MRAAERIEGAARLALALAHALAQLLHELLRHLARALAEIVEGALLGFGGAIEIAVAKCFLGVLHGFAGVAELTGGFKAILGKAFLQLVEQVAQALLAVAEAWA